MFLANLSCSRSLTSSATEVINAGNGVVSYSFIMELCSHHKSITLFAGGTASAHKSHWNVYSGSEPNDIGSSILTMFALSILCRITASVFCPSLLLRVIEIFHLFSSKFQCSHAN